MTDETNPNPEGDQSEGEQSEVAQLRDEIRQLRESLATPPRDPQREAADQFLAAIKKLQQDQWSHGFSVFEDRG